MSKSFEGMLIGKGLKFGLVVSRFNEFISKKLLEGAQDALHRHGVNDEDVDVAWTPGSFEIPLVALKLARTKRYDAIVCLGAVTPPEGGTSWQHLGTLGELGVVEAARQFMFGGPFIGALILLLGGLFSTISALNATVYSSSRVS